MNDMSVNWSMPQPRNSQRRRTFREAAESYVENGGEARYLGRIVAHLGDRPLDEIFVFDIKKMAVDLYPDHSNATRNRQALTPTRSVMLHGYERGWCNLIRLGRLRQDAPRRKKPASPAWLHTFTRQCDREGLAHVAAIVLFMAQTGARVSEAVALCWPQVDLANRRVVLLKTKTSANSMRVLTDELVVRIHALHDAPHPSGRVFHYTSRYSVNERICAVCERAGISYKSSHACGRHSFATNAMAFGADVRSAMEAGGWRSASVFLETYVSPRNAGRQVAERFNAWTYENEL